MKDTKLTGNITELTILLELIKRGYSVSIPYGDRARYDLIVDIPDKGIFRVQCKTA
jgi:hypothetical protein